MAKKSSRLAGWNVQENTLKNKNPNFILLPKYKCRKIDVSSFLNFLQFLYILFPSKFQWQVGSSILGAKIQCKLLDPYIGAIMLIEEGKSEKWSNYIKLFQYDFCTELTLIQYDNTIRKMLISLMFWKSKNPFLMLKIENNILICWDRLF